MKMRSWQRAPIEIRCPYKRGNVNMSLQKETHAQRKNYVESHRGEKKHIKVDTWVMHLQEKKCQRFPASPKSKERDTKQTLLQCPGDNFWTSGLQNCRNMEVRTLGHAVCYRGPRNIHTLFSKFCQVLSKFWLSHILLIFHFHTHLLCLLFCHLFTHKQPISTLAPLFHGTSYFFTSWFTSHPCKF